MKMIGKLWKDEGFRKAIYIFIIAKMLVISVGYAGYFLVPAEDSSRKQITGVLMNPWAQYDGRAYLDVAQNGYNSAFNGIGNYGWYPLYPALIKIFSFAGYDTAAFLLSNVFSFLAVVMLYLIVKEEFGDIARKTVTYFVLFPTAYFLSVMYAESLFIFLSVATFYYARKGNWLAAGVAGFFASLTRLQGLLLFLPIAYIYLDRIKFNYRKIKIDSLLTLLIPAGAAAFAVYLYFITGDAFVGSKVFAAQGKHFAMPWATFYTEAVNFFSAEVLKSKIYILFNTIIALSLIVACIVSRKYLRKDYVIYLVTSTLLPLFSGNLEAISRYALTIFPLFILVPLLEKNKKFSLLMKILLVISIVLLIVLTVRHVNMHLDNYGL